MEQQVLGEVWVVRAASKKNHPGWLSGLLGPFWPLSVCEQGKAAYAWLCSKRQRLAAWPSHSP